MGAHSKVSRQSGLQPLMEVKGHMNLKALVPDNTLVLYLYRHVKGPLQGAVY